MLAQSVDLRIGLELSPRIYFLFAEAIFERSSNDPKLTRYSGIGARLIYVSGTCCSSAVLPIVGVLGGVRHSLETVNLFGKVELNGFFNPLCSER